MKCNIHKINNFFNTNKHEDTREFIFKLLKILYNEDSSRFSHNDMSNYSLFLQLDFFTFEEGDEIEYPEELFIIDFFTISKFNTDFKKHILNLILESFNHLTSDFSDTVISGIMIPYEDWKQVNRKNKLQQLNEI